MGTPTPPGTPAVLPNAHSALINNSRDEFDYLNSFPSLSVSGSDVFSSFSEKGMPSTLVSHWFPLILEEDYPRPLSTISTLRSHYARLPNPGYFFTAMEDLMQEFRILLNAQHQASKAECKQS